MQRFSRRQVVRGAAATAAVAFSAPSVRAQNSEQVLRFVAEADLKVLDPIWTSAYITRNHGIWSTIPSSALTKSIKSSRRWSIKRSSLRMA